MSPARRTAKRRDWPRGLYEKRPGYYSWRHPLTGEEFAIGRVSLAHARNEALAANAHVSAEAPSLVARVSGQSNTVADLVADMPVSEKRSTRNTFRASDKIIVEGALRGGPKAAVSGTQTGHESNIHAGLREDRIQGLGAIQVGALTVKRCAELLDVMVKAGKEHQALAVRTRLIAVCARGIRKGWMATNPAEVTEKPDAAVTRGRLTLEQFLAIREAAQPWPWLARAMNLALVTGQDRSTIAAAQRKHVVDKRLICHRSKTADKTPPLAIPVAIRLEAIGMALEDILRERTGIVSPYLVHHTEGQGRARAGDPVGVNLITRAFSDARKLAGIPNTLPDGKAAPTFHEIRSLAKRLYTAQGNVDTRALLGHATEAMSRLYESTRDMTPIEVAIGAK